MWVLKVYFYAESCGLSDEFKYQFAAEICSTRNSSSRSSNHSINVYCQTTQSSCPRRQYFPHALFVLFACPHAKYDGRNWRCYKIDYKLKRLLSDNPILSSEPGKISLILSPQCVFILEDDFNLAPP